MTGQASPREEAMRYLLLICQDETAPITPEERTSMVRDTKAWVDEMDGRGVRLLGSKLRPVSETSTLRVRDDNLLVSDGPFAETKEQIAGFDIVECASLDHAVEVASRHPVARTGSIEVRPYWQE
jgi:hypothetical protein